MCLQDLHNISIQNTHNYTQQHMYRGETYYVLEFKQLLHPILTLELAVPIYIRLLYNQMDLMCYIRPLSKNVLHQTLIIANANIHKK
jgi:hypothetical protein